MKLEDVLDDEILRLNEQNRQALKEKLSGDKVTWILGAGVSVPAGLPQWTTLLAKMWARLSEIDPSSGSWMDDETAFKDAREARLRCVNDYAAFQAKVNCAYAGDYANAFQGINVLESAEYMGNYIDDLIKKAVDPKIREELKSRILKALIQDALSISDSRRGLIDKLENEAIGYLAKFLADKEEGVVITYNYDDVLETCLQEIGHMTAAKVHVVCDRDADKGNQNGKINIYHPHGAINIVGSGLGKESREIILTESSYYKMEQKVYNWENSVQAKALVETSCIFMGFSGDDYNFRRIIKNVPVQNRIIDSGHNGPEHYIFFCLDNLFRDVYGSELNKCHEEKWTYESLLLINRLYAQYSYWKKHGIISIWSTYEELPDMVRELTS